MRFFHRKSTYGLGRIPSPRDERDWNFPRLAEMVERGEALPVSWETPVILTQEGASCVGYSIATLCETAAEGADPNPTLDPTLGTRIYERAREIDGFGPEIKGATLRSGLKAAVEMGLVSAYARGTWETSTDWLRTKGPVVWGIPWYGDMYRPKGGVVQPAGSYAGGHAIVNSGDNQQPEDRMLPNTWGPRWGLNGYCFMSEPSLYQCFVSGGEVWTAVRRLDPIPRWPDLPDMNDDDLLSQHFVFVRGVMKGYSETEFRPGPTPTNPAPYGCVTVHQVGTVMERLGIKKNPWNHPSHYTLTAKRGWIHQELPMLRMDDLERPLDDVTRFAFMLMCGRYLRGA